MTDGPADAIDAARSPLDDLLERAKDDPGAALEPGSIQLLASLKREKPADYERARDKLKKIGVRVSAIDEAVNPVAATAVTKTTQLQGRALDLLLPEHWPEPVDGAALLDEIAATLQRYVAMGRAALTACALWIVLSYAFELLGINPRLILKSPTKRCGKTTLRDVIAALVAKPITADNITTAVLFRLIEEHRPTILLDEVDRLLGGDPTTKAELIGLMNAGHTPSGMVYRCEGDEHEVRGYSVFAPLLLSGIGRVPDTIEDRGIPIVMRRRNAGERVERLRRDRILADLLPLRRRIVRWAADHQAMLAAVDPVLPDGLDDRAADNWRPLLAIADAAGGDWPVRAREAAHDLCAGRAEDDLDRGVQLLADLHALFEARGTDRLMTAGILHHLHQLDERPWKEWGRRGQPITARQLATVLAPYGVRAGTIRLGTTTAKGYTRADLQDAWTRYLPPSVGADPSRRHSPATARPGWQSPSVTSEACDGCEIDMQASNGAACDAVTDSEGSPGQVEDAQVDAPAASVPAPDSWAAVEAEARRRWAGAPNLEELVADVRDSFDTSRDAGVSAQQAVRDAHRMLETSGVSSGGRPAASSLAAAVARELGATAATDDPAFDRAELLDPRLGRPVR